MKLNDLARLRRLHVGDFEESLREVLVVFGREKLHRQPDIMQLELLAFALRPIWMALDLFLLDDFVEHEDGL